MGIYNTTPYKTCLYAALTEPRDERCQFWHVRDSERSIARLQRGIIISWVFFLKERVRARCARVHPGRSVVLEYSRTIF